MTKTTLEPDPRILAARQHWRWRGQERPPFAEPVGDGEESVWDFPRPPRLETVELPLRVVHGEHTLARSERGRRVCETAGAPTYYFPPEDVDESQLRVVPGASLCEWKGIATGFSVPGVQRAAWCYAQTFAEFSAIAGWYAFYPGALACYVGDERVEPQPGGYYGGWVTRSLRGPIKGEAGSEAW